MLAGSTGKHIASAVRLGAARRSARGQVAGSRTTVTVQSDSATTWPDTLPR